MQFVGQLYQFKHRLNSLHVESNLRAQAHTGKCNSNEGNRPP